MQSGRATSCFLTAGITTKEQRKSKSSTKKRRRESEIRNRRSEVGDQRLEVSDRRSARGKKRFRLFDHPAKHSASLCTFPGQRMMLFRRDISAPLGEVQR